jgi:triacylglycerol lipase
LAEDAIKHTAVVFIHGFLGFGELRLPVGRVAYFRGLRTTMDDLGVSGYFPSLPAGRSVAERATALATFLETIPEPGLILIAHSMGGLDSRYLIHKLDPEHRVRRLVTIGTPHRGTALAEWALHAPRILNWLGRVFGRRALEDLRPSACDRFNKEIPDRSDVVYSSYAANRPIAEMPLLLRRWARIVAREEEGDNDSQVSVPSARWGEFKGVLMADHIELLGWNLARRKKPKPFDHISFYRDLVASMLA